MSITKTTFDNYIEQSENLYFFKQLRWFNKSVGLENIITELEASIREYLEPIELLFVQSLHENHLRIMAELEIEGQS